MGAAWIARAEQLSWPYSAFLGLRYWRPGGIRFRLTRTLQLLKSGRVRRERDKGLLRGVLVGGVWNGFLLEKVKGQRDPCRFCGY